VRYRGTARPAPDDAHVEAGEAPVPEDGALGVAYSGMSCPGRRRASRWRPRLPGRPRRAAAAGGCRRDPRRRDRARDGVPRQLPVRPYVAREEREAKGLIVTLDAEHPPPARIAVAAVLGRAEAALEQHLAGGVQRIARGPAGRRRLPDYANNEFFFDLLSGLPRPFKIGETCAELYTGQPAPAAPIAAGRKIRRPDHHRATLGAADLPARPPRRAPALPRRYPDLPILIPENGIEPRTACVAPTAGRARRCSCSTSGRFRPPSRRASRRRLPPLVAHRQLRVGKLRPRFGLYRVDALTDPRLSATRRRQSPSTAASRATGGDGRAARAVPGR